MNRKENLEIICGPMFSGKTEFLLIRISDEVRNNKRVIVFKPSIDNRYSDDYIVSHNQNKIKCTTIMKAEEILQYKNDFDVFAIDEIQFLNHEIVSVCNILMMENKKIIAAGLDNDYRAVPFKQMAQLICLSDNITKLNAICVKCGKDANLSYRISNEKDLILIGESEEYEARCEECYYNK